MNFFGVGGQTSQPIVSVRGCYWEKMRNEPCRHGGNELISKRDQQMQICCAMSALSVFEMIQAGRGPGGRMKRTELG